jgi:hypothetical protein
MVELRIDLFDKSDLALVPPRGRPVEPGLKIRFPDFFLREFTKSSKNIISSSRDEFSNSTGIGVSLHAYGGFDLPALTFRIG